MDTIFMSFISVYMKCHVFFQCLENNYINKSYHIHRSLQTMVVNPKFCVQPHTQTTKIACEHVVSTVTPVYGETKGGRRMAHNLHHGNLFVDG